MKHLIVIHGRSIKPARAPMAGLTQDVLVEGLARSGNSKKGRLLADGKVKLSFAYYGDINNKLLAGDEGKLLTAIDPEINEPCFPIAELRDAFEETKKIRKFSKAEYRKVLALAKDLRFLDEASDFASLIAVIASFGVLNTVGVKYAKPDMGAYLTSHQIASAIRERLHRVLDGPIASGDDVCIVAHSMGAMVAYDVLWKYSHMSEYSALRATNPRITLFLTIGCPLGEPGVRRNLIDGRHPPEDQYPRNIIGVWQNVHAEDDYIAHVEKMRRAFSPMLRRKYLDDIRDTHIYNCWTYRDTPTGNLVSNPHDFYGYLMSEQVAQRVADWM